MKKILLVSLLTMFTCVSVWGANVAKIGDTEYSTLAAAVTAANAAEGDVTITMLVTSPSATTKLTISNNITIDGGNTRRTLKNTFSVSAGKTLTLKNITVNNTVKPSPARTVVLNGKDAKLILSDATLEPKIASCLPLGVVSGKSATLELAEGTSNVIKNISGSSALYHSATSGYSLTITGNGALSVQHVGTGGYAFGCEAKSSSASSSAKFIIDAPNITATSATAGRVFSTNLTTSSVSSGVYSDAPADKLISTGCAKLALTGADAGKYRVFSLTTATATANGVKASIGKTAYSSLAAAISAAQAGETVTLWADATAASVTKAITIAANGYNASAITAGSGFVRVPVDGGYAFGQVHTSQEAGHTVYTVNNYDEFIFANYAVANGDIIRLANDIAYTANGKTDAASLLNIKKSITLDGQGHTISGYWKKSDNYYLTLAINHQGTEMLDVTIQNVTITNNVKYASSIISFGKLASLTLENCQLIQQHKLQPYGLLFIGTHQDTPANVTINNSKIANTNAEDNGNPIMINVPINLTINNSTTVGWRALYFQFARTMAGYACDGARGTVVHANSCLFNGRNGYDGINNGSSTFFCEDDGITLNLHNCTLCAEQMGTAAQYVLGFASSTPANRRTQNIVMNISGDNTTINGKFVDNGYWFYPLQASDPNNLNFVNYSEGYYYYSNGYNYKKGSQSTTENYDPSKAFEATMHITLNITGGTYSVDPLGNTWDTKWVDRPIFSETAPYAKTGQCYSRRPTIPSGYEVKEITTTQGGVTTTLYRVREEITSSTTLNDNAGQNETEEIKVTESITVANEETKAEYVEVKGGTSSDPIVTVTVPEGKTLEVSNGMDVTGNAEVVVEPGSTLSVGEGGLISEKPENIIIEADQTGSASLLLDPAVIINTTPNLTVRMTAKQIGRDAAGDFYWHRYAMPVASISGWDKEGSLVGAGSYEVQYRTYVYAWDYSANDWVSIAPNAMAPLKGYTLTLASDYIHVNGEGKVTSEATKDGNLNTLQDVTYIFKGNLVGNTDQPLTFEKEGFNYFGNSYTGYMHALTVLNGIESEHVDGTIYMWNAENQNYAGVSKNKLSKNRGLEEWQKEIAPMQTFILRLRGADSANEGVSYADAIWNNPRYGNAASAPARRALADDDDEEAYMDIIVTSANGKSDVVDFTQMASKSDAYENGYDSEKYMNPGTINLYATIGDMNYSSVVTNVLLGKTLSLQTVDETDYTISFEYVEGEQYALRDKVTNDVVAISNDVTYSFSAQPNAVAENRFEIVSIDQVPTAVDNVVTTPKHRGIYTMLGQYVGEDFKALPAGVYIVNGVKIVK